MTCDSAAWKPVSPFGPLIKIDEGPIPFISWKYLARKNASLKMHVVKISDLKNLFPSKLHAVIFVAYMGLFINQGTCYDVE